jgi:hypothetical protein
MCSNEEEMQIWIRAFESGDPAARIIGGKLLASVEL